MPNPTESFTQPPPNAGGANIRLFQITRPDGTVVTIQGVALVDAVTQGAIASVTGDGLLQVLVKQQDKLLAEIRRTNRILELAFGNEVSMDDVGLDDVA
jgi:hypothetical protein